LDSMAAVLASTVPTGCTIRLIGLVSPIPTGRLRDASRQIRLHSEQMGLALAPAILQFRRTPAGMRSRAARTGWQYLGTLAASRRSLACHLGEERRGAFQRRQVGKCNPFHT